MMQQCVLTVQFNGSRAMDTSEQIFNYAEWVTHPIPAHVLWMRKEFEEGEEYTVFQWDHPACSASTHRCLNELRGVLHASVDVMESLCGWPASIMYFDWGTDPYTASFFQTRGYVGVLAFMGAHDREQIAAATGYFFDTWVLSGGQQLLHTVISVDADALACEEVGVRAFQQVTSALPTEGACIQWQNSWQTSRMSTPTTDSITKLSNDEAIADIRSAAHSELRLFWDSLPASSSSGCAEGIDDAQILKIATQFGKNVKAASASRPSAAAIVAMAPLPTILDAVGSEEQRAWLCKCICTSPIGRDDATLYDISIDWDIIASRLAEAGADGIITGAGCGCSVGVLPVYAAVTSAASGSEGILEAALSAVTYRDHSEAGGEPAAPSLLDWLPGSSGQGVRPNSTTIVQDLVVRLNITPSLAMFLLLTQQTKPVTNSYTSLQINLEAMHQLIVDGLLCLYQAQLRSSATS